MDNSAGRDSPVPRAGPFLEVDDVHLGYASAHGQAVLACRDLRIRVSRGEFVVIVGPSGCGKTTLLEAVAGLVPVAAGEIRIDGVPISGPGRDRAIVFQSPSLFPWRDVYGNAAAGLEAQGRLDEEGRATVQRILETVGLAHVARRRPRELSGGMRQRVNLARALAIDPEMLLLDEPFGALDAQTREKLQDELIRIWQGLSTGRERTALFVTHDVREAVLLADRVLVFSEGPGTVVADVHIDLPRPRGAAVKRDDKFLEYEAEILGILYGDEGRSSGPPSSSARPDAKLADAAVAGAGVPGEVQAR